MYLVAPPMVTEMNPAATDFVPVATASEIDRFALVPKIVAVLANIALTQTAP